MSGNLSKKDIDAETSHRMLLRADYSNPTQDSPPVAVYRMGFPLQDFGEGFKIVSREAAFRSEIPRSDFGVCGQVPRGDLECRSRSVSTVVITCNTYILLLRSAGSEPNMAAFTPGRTMRTGR
jgi:hypothetical protein